MRVDVEAEFDHNDPNFIREPHAVYRRLHESQPVLHSECYGGFWLLTKYHDVRSALLDWRSFSSGTPGVTSIPTSVKRDFPEIPLEVDPPAHTVYRDIVTPWFSRGSVLKLEDEVRRITTELIDEFIAAGAADVVQQFALPLVSRVLTVFLGLPEEHSVDLTGWITDIFQGRLHDRERADRASVALIRYVDDTITDRRANPADDYFTMLTRATIDGRGLTDLEIRGYGVVTMTAGQETTVNGIGNSLWYLAEHPGDKQRLIDDPALIPNAIEEFLRYMSPIQLLGRSTTQTVEVDGTKIPSGQTVAICYGAANVDEEVFDRAGECIIDRRPNPHVAFGTGPHACLGAHLARLEMRVAIEEVLRRLPDYRLEAPDRLEYTAHGDLRGFWSLPVVFGLGDPCPGTGSEFGLMLLARHGHVDVPDAIGRFNSEGSVYLSTRGQEQASDLAQRLRAVRVDRICASDMPRAAQTAEIIGEAVGLTVEIKPGLRELNCGSLDGAVLVDLQRDHPEFAPWILGGYLQGFSTAESHFRADLTFPGGESILGMAERVIPVFRRLCAETMGGVTLLVTHAWPIAVMCCHLLGLPASEYFRFGTPHAGLSVARVGADGRGILDAVNITSRWEVIAGGSLPLAAHHAL